MRLRWKNQNAACAAGALLVVLPISALSQEVPVVQSESSSLEKIVVTGNRGDDRRDATAAKTVVTREAIIRYGDTNLADVLRRLPGITVSKSSNGDSSIRMRGLGEGYTQLMINGEPVPPGTTIDSISPDLIERIEVIRTATADQSTQAIAGTINVILKRSTRQRDRNLKVGLQSKNGLVSNQVSSNYGERTDASSWSVAANLGVDRDQWPTTTQQIASDGQGRQLYSRLTNTDDSSKQTTLGLTSNALWKWGDTRTLNLDGFIQAQRSELGEFERRQTLLGTLPQFGGDSLQLPTDGLLARITGGLKLDWGDAGRLEQKISASLTRKNSDGLREFFDDPSQPILNRLVVAHLKDSNGTWTGKYSLPIQDKHTLDVGWDSQITKRSEQRNQTETSPVNYPIDNFDQSYDARITRQAVYVQDETSLTNGISIYGGVRWEWLRTQVTGTDAMHVSQQSSVLSPIVQLVWKLPNSKSDQLRASLGRTYRPPTSKDLIPRLWLTPDNSVTAPDFEGNPELRPELAWALDAAYEHYFPGSGMLGISLYTKRISNVILQQLFLAGGRWVTSPYNGGKATASGIEIETKAKFTDIISRAPDGELRLSVNRNWSHVDNIPSPGSRLDQQAPLTLSLGADFHPMMQLTSGIGYVYNRGAFTRKSVWQFTTTADTHSLDLYSLWKVTKETQVRAALSIVPGPDNGLRDGYTDPGLNVQQLTESPRQHIFKLQFQHLF